MYLASFSSRRCNNAFFFQMRFSLGISGSSTGACVTEWASEAKIFCFLSTSCAASIALDTQSITGEKIIGSFFVSTRIFLSPHHSHIYTKLHWGGASYSWWSSAHFTSVSLLLLSFGIWVAYHFRSPSDVSLWWWWRVVELEWNSWGQIRT